MKKLSQFKGNDSKLNNKSLDLARDESYIHHKKQINFEDKILSQPFNFYGMYLSITDEEWESTL